jgi:hypothetical protein
VNSSPYISSVIFHENSFLAVSNYNRATATGNTAWATFILHDGVVFFW